jgi:Zn-dependent protease with chaperone function
MNFFAAQKKAKKYTFRLFVLEFLGLIGIVACAELVIISILYYLNSPNPQTFIEFSTELILGLSVILFPIVLFIIFFASLYKRFSLRRNGGKAIAEALGGKLLNHESDNIDEKKVLNVVEEMAIASGISVPPVYMLDDESINAFAAGFDKDDIVIGVTKGTVKLLSRDELQGVIAHEFSHIFNGDMKINMNITSSLYGLLFLGMTGRSILYALSRMKSNSDKADNIKFALSLLGVSFIIIGFFGYLFGHIMKLAISRQREYLADATAVQYTRDTQGIANALKKIGGFASGSKIESTKASEFSHFYFANGDKSFISKMMSTHPPLDVRIKVLDKDWDGIYLNPLKSKKEDKVKSNKQKTTQKSKHVILVSTLLNSLDRIGEPNVDAAKEMLELIPKSIKKESASLLGSINVVLSLLLDKNSEEQRVKQLGIVSSTYSESFSKDVVKVYNDLMKNYNGSYLNIASVSIPQLRQLSINQYETFRKVFLELIQSDNKVSFYEWMMQRIIINQLDVVFGIKKAEDERYYSIQSIKDEINLLISKFAYSEYKDNVKSKEAVESLRKNGNQLLEYIDSNHYTLEDIDRALDKIALADKKISVSILKDLIVLADHNGELSQIELDLIKTISISVGIPIPAIN